jgi:selenide, water dikinase
MGSDALAHVLRPLTATFGAEAANDLLVGLGHADDAAVYRLNDDQAIVATTDFFPPVVDDPYTFGAIAAANALSDIYAMGGDPLFCLNLVGFPDDLDPDILTEIMRGGAEKVREAGALIAGGHSVTDHEPKYGLAAIGLVHPQRIFTKGGAQPGDHLLLTKPIGTGVITTAAKAERADAADLESAIASMLRLNGPAMRALRTLDRDLHACTDITGFGLLGHGWEMAEQSGVTLRIFAGAVPLLPGAATYAAGGFVPGGTGRNRAAIEPHTRWAETVDKVTSTLLCDPQTSGGLFAAIAPDAVERAVAALAEAGITGAVVGRVEAAGEAGPAIVVETAGDGE